MQQPNQPEFIPYKSPATVQGQEMPHEMVPIWFIIGINVLVYGVVILGTGLLHWRRPPQEIAMSNLHADVWWGALMTIIGLFYTLHFMPTKKHEADQAEPSSPAPPTKWD